MMYFFIGTNIDNLDIEIIFCAKIPKSKNLFKDYKKNIKWTKVPLESFKTKKILDNELTNYFKGKGVDIDCGPCPISENALGFDIDSGDANNIKAF